MELSTCALLPLEHRARHCEGGFVDASRLDDHPPAQPEDWGHLVAMFRRPSAHKLSLLRYLVRAARACSTRATSVRRLTMHARMRARSLPHLCVCSCARGHTLRA